MRDRRRWLLRQMACALALATVGLPARAQTGRVARVGFASWFAPTETGQIDPLRAGLRDLGWVESRNLELEVHFTQGDAARTRRVLESFVQRGFDVIVVRATNVAHIAKEVTRTVPIVMLVADPLATGLVQSLARPEANLTGLSLQGPDLAGKRLEYLRSIMPGLRRVGFLGAASDPNVKTFVRETRAAAEAFGVELDVHLVPGVNAFSAKDFDELAARGVQALLVQPLFTGHQDRIVEYASRRRIAVVSNYEVFARAGGLLTLGPDDAALTRRAAWFVDRLLRGASPRDLPVEQPSRFTLAVNASTARALGVALPASLRMLADVVHE